METTEHKLRRVPRIFEIVVTGANQRFTETFELDKSVKKVNGIAFACEKPDLMFHRAYGGLEINNAEFFPENHAIQRLMNGVDAPLNVRYWQLDDVIVGNGKVKFDLTDKADGRTIFASYTVQMYLDCEIETN